MAHKIGLECLGGGGIAADHGGQQGPIGHSLKVAFLQVQIAELDQLLDQAAPSLNVNHNFVRDPGPNMFAHNSIEC